MKTITMPSQDSAATLVARFLRSNSYDETLDIFLKEAGLPPETGSSSENALTIEQVLQEKKTFDLSREFEKTNLDNGDSGWSVPAPTIPKQVETLPGPANILHVSIDAVEKRSGEAWNFIVATAADRTVNFLSPNSPYSLNPAMVTPSESPVLSCITIDQRYFITSSMSGRVALHDLRTKQVLDERTDHSKYVVKLAYIKLESTIWVASAAWDARILVYRLSHSSEGSAMLGVPIGEVKLPTNPESILFVHHPEMQSPLLLASRRDSTFLYYYTLLDMPVDGSHSQTPLVYLGRQNLAPHSNAWVAFTPSALALSPNDPSLLAVATSAVPHMKLIIVRLLLPPAKSDSRTTDGDAEHLTQASQARANLALQDREAAAILIHCTTLAPQTAYSTPALAWRHDASGIFVNGDDGVVRGIETSTGKIVASLKDGHEAGTKIRCLCTGIINEDGEEKELLVSGGFDRRLVVWQVE